MKEVEIPDWAMREYDTEDDCVKSYLCDHPSSVPVQIPVWGSRFCPSRIKWEKVNKTPAEMQEVYKKKINRLRISIQRLQDEMNELKKLLV
jgi:hypothetical protein